MASQERAERHEQSGLLFDQIKEYLNNPQNNIFASEEPEWLTGTDFWITQKIFINIAPRTGRLTSLDQLNNFLNKIAREMPPQRSDPARMRSNPFNDIKLGELIYKELLGEQVVKTTVEQHTEIYDLEVFQRAGVSVVVGDATKIHVGKATPTREIYLRAFPDAEFVQLITAYVKAQNAGRVPYSRLFSDYRLFLPTHFTEAKRSLVQEVKKLRLS